MILQSRNITKLYTNHLALDDISVDVPRGSIYGLLGPNGAGKTTFIRIINRITMPDSGQVIFNGEPLSSKHITKIGYMPEERGLYKKMKVGEQVLFFAQLKGLSYSEAIQKIKPWFEKLKITSWWNMKVEELSKGMAQKIQFIITVLHQPELLIFDEPFSGFDPVNANIIKNEILSLRDKGTTIIFSTHNMNSVEEICDHITLINKSKNILSGNIADIKRTYSQGEYKIDYNGDTDRLIDVLTPLCTIKSQSNLSTNALQSIVILGNDKDKRDLIRVVNETVEIKHLSEQVPSMNEIFLKMVGSSNTEPNSIITE
ncbi:MAG: ATP-binding cassette domain-containing protein [Rikenellaceae bacterium]